MEVRDLERSDIPALKTSGIPTEFLLQANNRVHVAITQGIVGLVVWQARPRPQSALLSALITTDTAPPETIHRLALHAALAAQAEGYTSAVFDIFSEALLQRLVTLYGIEPTPAGIDPQTQEPLSWEHEINIADALSILIRILPEPTS